MTDDDILGLVPRSRSVHDLLLQAGLAVSDNSMAAMRARLLRLGADTEHFAGATTRGAPVRRRTVENTLRLGQPSDGRTPAALLRRALLEIGRPHVCEVCGIGPVWQGAPLVLEIDHINGVRHDNRDENLRFLCPNCHTQTPTRRRSRKPRWCRRCGTPVSKNAVHCLTCYDAAERRARVRVVSKIDWPSDRDLAQMVHTTSYSEVGRQLGVSANAVKYRFVGRKR